MPLLLAPFEARWPGEEAARSAAGMLGRNRI